MTPISICPSVYACNNLRTVEQTYIKLASENIFLYKKRWGGKEFLQHFSTHFVVGQCSWQFGMKTYMHFCAYHEHTP
jgi:hypothetical protein